VLNICAIGVFQNHKGVGTADVADDTDGKGPARQVTLQRAPDLPASEKSATIRGHLRFQSLLPALCAEHLRHPRHLRLKTFFRKCTLKAYVESRSTP